jgi:hypothetical protein
MLSWFGQALGSAEDLAVLGIGWASPLRMEQDGLGEGGGSKMGLCYSVLWTSCGAEHFFLWLLRERFIEEVFKIYPYPPARWCVKYRVLSIWMRRWETYSTALAVIHTRHSICHLHQLYRLQGIPGPHHARLNLELLCASYPMPTFVSYDRLLWRFALP